MFFDCESYPKLWWFKWADPPSCCFWEHGRKVWLLMLSIDQALPLIFWIKYQWVSVFASFAFLLGVKSYEEETFRDMAKLWFLLAFFNHAARFFPEVPLGNIHPVYGLVCQKRTTQLLLRCAPRNPIFQPGHGRDFGQEKQTCHEALVGASKGIQRL